MVRLDHYRHSEFEFLLVCSLFPVGPLRVSSFYSPRLTIPANSGPVISDNTPFRSRGTFDSGSVKKYLQTHVLSWSELPPGPYLSPLLPSTSYPLFYTNPLQRLLYPPSFHTAMRPQPSHGPPVPRPLRQPPSNLYRAPIPFNIRPLPAPPPVPDVCGCWLTYRAYYDHRTRYLTNTPNRTDNLRTRLLGRRYESYFSLSGRGDGLFRGEMELLWGIFYDPYMWCYHRDPAWKELKKKGWDRSAPRCWNVRMLMGWTPCKHWAWRWAERIMGERRRWAERDTGDPRAGDGEV